MQIVIDIPEEIKKKIDNNLNACDLDVYDCVMIATKNGMSLDKMIGDIKAEIENYDYFILCANGQKGIHIDEALKIIDNNINQREESKSETDN